jgi:hypothetical protein
MLLASPPFFCIDNIAHPLESSALCVLLTEEGKNIRPLSTSDFPEVTFRPFVECTGNNLVLVGDLTGRTIRCTIDAQCEQPELREIKRPGLVRDVKKDRGRYAVAALTIVQAFICAGAPPQTTLLGSFEKWSLYIRDALVWLGCADPCATMEAIHKENPKRNNAALAMNAWAAVLGEDYRTTVREVTAAAAQTFDGELVHQNLHDALMEVAGDRGTINSRKLAWWLRQNSNAVVDGRYFSHTAKTAMLLLCGC